jgi:Protein of unknown function (DUF3485)
MNREKYISILVALALIGSSAMTLGWMKKNQKLGQPGVKAAPIPDSKRLALYLPADVLNYHSEVIPTDTNVLEGLPQDTSFAQRRYTDSEGNWILLNVVLMGTDRTSIHKPQFCLAGSGWTINDNESSPDMVPISRPQPYGLPVMKLTSSRSLTVRGKPVPVRGIYVYWFVADHDLTEDHWVRMRHMSSHLLATGELQRWAYVSSLVVCLPGEEAKAYDKMKKFLAAAVPEFQKTSGMAVAGLDLQTAGR